MTDLGNSTANYLSGYNNRLFGRPQSITGAGGDKILDLSLSPDLIAPESEPANPTGIQAFKPTVDTGTYKSFEFKQPDFKLPELAAPQEPLSKAEIIRNVRNTATDMIGETGVKGLEIAAGVARIARGGTVGNTFKFDKNQFFDSSSIKIEGSFKGNVSVNFKASF